MLGNACKTRLETPALCCLSHLSAQLLVEWDYMPDVFRDAGAYEYPGSGSIRREPTKLSDRTNQENGVAGFLQLTWYQELCQRIVQAPHQGHWRMPAQEPQMVLRAVISVVRDWPPSRRIHPAVRVCTPYQSTVAGSIWSRDQGIVTTGECITDKAGQQTAGMLRKHCGWSADRQRRHWLQCIRGFLCDSGKPANDDQSWRLMASSWPVGGWIAQLTSTHGLAAFFA